ncbi:hypothetical protein LCM23_06225 [Cytobacillus kochii]|uniref:hypothetical protein n=1 Tax=Cytobacillus kochii TaxID=859143 RepID=UPI001CD46542|nr:hypothetical protein [Cytobacillus kochii]MCA1025681.1 hypothetical protein [Cytobacillus kochii]
MNLDKSEERFKCTSCGKERILNRDFYTSFSTFHKATERLHICKSCMQDHIKNNDFISFLDLLRRIDKPYIQKLYDSACKQNNMLGEYMKLVNTKDYRLLSWNDSDFEGHKDMASVIHTKSDDSSYLNDEKIYSRSWLGYYLPSEIDYLEEYLKGLDRDFRIVTLSHRDYAKKIAKASLHMDKCFQEMQDGVSGADKRYKEAKGIFDTLSKSAKFSESQRGITDVGMGSISQIVEMVESETFVYEHKNDLDKDNYDKLIDDFQHIYKSL